MFGNDGDVRMLGVACFELVITEVDDATVRSAQQQNAAQATAAKGRAYSPGTVITFGRNGNIRRYGRFGWNEPEDTFTWTTAQPATIELELPPSEGPLELKMKLAGLIDEKELPVQPTHVFANDRQIAEWQVGTTGEFTAVIPREIISSGNPLTLALHAPKAATPKELGMGDDKRVLGVRCDALVLRPL
jgi:hypothetical protein